MPERITAENLLCNVVDTLADSVPKQKPMTFFEEQRSMSSQMNRLFGRQKPLHKLLGGGKCECFCYSIFSTCMRGFPFYFFCDVK